MHKNGYLLLIALEILKGTGNEINHDGFFGLLLTFIFHSYHLKKKVLKHCVIS